MQVPVRLLAGYAHYRKNQMPFRPGDIFDIQPSDAITAMQISSK